MEDDEQPQRAEVATNKPPLKAKRTIYPRFSGSILRHQSFLG
jgi:hypothetical protein